MVWFCKPCYAYIACRNNTKTPLGTMAGPELRNLRYKAHQIFDPLWNSGQMTQVDAYAILEREFGAEIRIESSNAEQCKKIIEFLT